MSFTQDLALQTADLRRQIHDMPFNRELAHGSLPAEVFRGYIVQDAHYLEGFARALSLAAAKAPDPATIAQLAGSAGTAAAVERLLHGHYMALYGVSEAQFRATGVSQACDHYIASLIRACALGDFPEALAALLPCFWIYHDVGHEIAAMAAPGNPYAEWIATYSGEDFSAGVAKMLALTDRVAAAADAATRARMQKVFARSCWHEWHFWDSAYHRRNWPKPVTAAARNGHSYHRSVAEL